MSNRTDTTDKLKSKRVRIKEYESIRTLKDKNISKARSEVIHYIERYPDDMYGYHLYGKICQEMGDYDEAEAAYAKVAESDSRNKYGGVVGLAEIARLRNRIPQAKRYYYQAVVESNGDQTYAAHALARLERLDENYDEALRVLELLGKKTNVTEIEKVKVLGAQGNFKTALQILDSLVPENTSQKRSIAYERAKIARNTAKFAEAKYYIMEAKEYGIKDATYYKILEEEARLALDMEEYQLAIDCCGEFFATNQTLFGSINLVLACAKQALGQYQSALTNYHLAVDLSKKAPKTYSAANYYLGCLEYLMGDFEVAEKHLKESVLPGRPLETSVVAKLISMYIRQERYDEAIACIETAKPNCVTDDERDLLSLATLVIAKRTNQPLPKRSSTTYRERQVVEYRKDDAIDHIRSHHQNFNKKGSNFSKTIDIETLYAELQTQMTEENKANIDIMDIYLIDYPNAGIDATGEISHKIGVVALPGTKDIITMYPAGRNLIRQGDITKTVTTQKSKVNDRISKFNARFANFTPPKK